MDDTESRGPDTPKPNATPAGPTPPPEAANEVLQDEIESIHAIGEDQ